MGMPGDGPNGRDQIRAEVDSNKLSSHEGHRRTSPVSARVKGKIVAVRENGNLVTDIDVSQLVDAPRDERVLIRCDEHETTCIFDAGHDQPPATLIAVLGESGRLELEVVGDSARIMLGVGMGEGVEVSW